MEAVIVIVLHFLWTNGVGQNITASALLGLPTVYHLHKKLTRHHKERLDQAEAHHQATHEHLTKIRMHQMGQAQDNLHDTDPV